MPRDSSGTKGKVRLVLDGICRQGKVSELCKQGGISRSTYYYVESKEELLIKVQGTAMQQMIVGLSRILEVEASYSEKLRAAFVYHLSFFGVLYARVVAFAGHSIDELPPALRERTRGERSTYEKLWRRLVTEGQLCGEFRRDLDVAMVVRALLGMANWLSIWYREKGEWQPSQIAEVFAKIALEGLAQSRSG